MEFFAGDGVVAKKKPSLRFGALEDPRTGAEIKLKCEGCGRIVLLSPDEVRKMCKKIVKSGESDG